MHHTALICAALAWATAGTTVLADDWVVNRLRGQAEQYDGQQWHSLAIGDTVASSRHVRTYHGSRMELVRGAEIIEMAPATFLVIHEAAGRKMTTVDQSLGSVTIQAEKKDIEHFSVETPVLAAVVKGTKFTVTIEGDGASVDVSDGVVEVSDTQHDVVANVVAGQSAASGTGEALHVSGPGSQQTTYVVKGVPVAANQVERLTGVPQGREAVAAGMAVSLTAAEHGGGQSHRPADQGGPGPDGPVGGHGPGAPGAGQAPGGPGSPPPVLPGDGDDTGSDDGDEDDGHDDGGSEGEPGPGSNPDAGGNSGNNGDEDDDDDDDDHSDDDDDDEDDNDDDEGDD